MILRRIIKHVQNQNWVAIVIDLFIVIVGVYIGIQAQAWTTERENRAIENQYLWSLHDNLQNMIESNEDRVAVFQERSTALSEVTDYFEAAGDQTRLERRHCIAIAQSHIYVGRIVVPPTIEELLTTGRLQLIRNDAVRLAIIAYSQAIEGMRQLNYDIQADRAVLSRRHPELITLSIQGWDHVTCDFDAMRRSRAFRNELADNSYRYGSYVGNVVVGQQELRVGLHALLDRELEINHADN